MSGVGRKSWAQDVDNRSQKNVQNQNKVAVKTDLPTADTGSIMHQAWCCPSKGQTPDVKPEASTARTNEIKTPSAGKAQKYYTTHIKTPPLRTSTRGKCGRYGHLRATAKPLHLIGREARSPRDERVRWQIVVAVVDRLLKGTHSPVRGLCFL